MRKIFTAIALLTALFTLGAAGTSHAGNYWDKWAPGKAKGPMPDCGVNVLPLGGDEILQATVDTYCKLKPGAYVSYVNPAIKKTYDARGDKYPDGKGAVLVFKAIGAVFTTDFAGGKIVYDVLAIKDEKSIASKDKGHPLNPETCATCHAGYNKACRGGICGNRMN